MESFLELFSLISCDGESASFLQILGLEGEDDVLDISKVRDIRDAGEDDVVVGDVFVLKSRLNHLFTQISPGS